MKLPAPLRPAAPPLARRPVRRTGRFLQDASGVSALEFALILPFMLLLLVGMAELSHAIDNWRKVTLLARAVSDLTSQGDKQTPMSTATMTDILASSKLVLRPFNSSGVKIVVSALGVDTTKSLVKPVVCSSTASSNATARSVGIASDLTLPPGFQAPGMRYVLAEVTMPYAPMLGSTLVNMLGGTNGQIALAASIPWPTRGGQPYGLNTYSEIVLPNGSPC